MQPQHRIGHSLRSGHITLHAALPPRGRTATLVAQLALKAPGQLDTPRRQSRGRLVFSPLTVSANQVTTVNQSRQVSDNTI